MLVRFGSSSRCKSAFHLANVASHLYLFLSSYLQACEKNPQKKMFHLYFGWWQYEALKSATLRYWSAFLYVHDEDILRWRVLAAWIICCLVVRLQFSFSFIIMARNQPPNSQFTIPICSATPSLIHQELALADGLNGSEWLFTISHGAFISEFMRDVSG